MGCKPCDWLIQYFPTRLQHKPAAHCAHFDVLDILQLRPFDYSHIQVYSLGICSLCLVPRGLLVFSVVNLVFVLVVLSISLCKCRFLDLYLVFLRFTSFGKSIGNVFFCSLSVRYLICSIALVPKVVIVSNFSCLSLKIVKLAFHWRWIFAFVAG